MQLPQPPDDNDEEMIQFLMEMREEAIAEGVDFYGAIIGGEGPPRIISYMSPGTMDQLEDEAD